RHSSRVVRAVAFSPDRKILATGCHDRTARLWDYGSGKELGPPLKHDGPLQALAFSPDGRTLLCGCDDRTVRLWDVATGQGLPFSPLRHGVAVEAVAFTPDGKTVLSAGLDRVCLWDAATGALREPVLSLPGKNRAAALSPDGERFVTVATDS